MKRAWWGAIAIGACCASLACGQKDSGTKAPDKQPVVTEEPKQAAAIDCSWKCHCASQLDDCDAHESQHDICIDARYTKHDRQVANCDECKRVAATDCAQRSCPPDPAGGPKFVLEHVCGGVSHTSSDVNGLEGAVASPASVFVDLEKPRIPEEVEKRASEEIAQKAAVTCTFGCTCMVQTGMCDDHENRYRMCSDKQDNTETASDCGMCEIRAQVACWNKPCPIAGGTTKTMTRFSCP